MDKYEQLSDDELRSHVIAAGLGNIPVTKTTRELLIKRLRNTENGTSKTKGRRETINVPKKSSADDSESENDAKKIKPKGASRRMTIAVTTPKTVSPDTQESKTTVVPPKSPSRKQLSERPKSPSRRQLSERPKSPSRKPIPEPTFEIEDQIDDDLCAAAEIAEIAGKLSAQKRSSRSPSLSKSTVVTTSYKHVIPESKAKNDDIIFPEFSDNEYNSEMLEKIKKPSTPTTKLKDHRRETLQLGPSISNNYIHMKPTEKNPTEIRRRYTDYVSPSRNNHESDEDLLNKVQTPYLSDFTRRLAELKAEPLFDTYKTKPNYEYRSKIPDRMRNKPNAWSNFEQMIRWPLFIVFILICIVTIYVFFFSNY